MIKKNRAFTMIEVMMTMVLMAIIAAYTIPNFYKSVARTVEKDIMTQVSTIHAAQVFYFQQTATYFDPGNITDTADINAGLGLSIIKNQSTFDCDAPGATTFECHGVATGASSFIVRVTEAPLLIGVNPCCESGACPTIANEC